MNADRFMAQVNQDGPTLSPELGPCWLWTRSTDGRYGVLWVGGKRIKAHRLAFGLFLGGGVIPEGMDVCHRCDNPPCVRPEHLFLGTMSDNIRDAVRKGRVTTPTQRGLPPWNAGITHCKRGHPLSGDNALHNSGRRCRACAKLHRARYRSTRRDDALLPSGLPHA